MMIDVRIPNVDESITVCVLAKWLVDEGHWVEKGAALFELEMDKTISEVPAPESGRVTRIVEEGENVEVAVVVARIDTGEAERAKELVTLQSHQGAASGEGLLASSVEEVSVRTTRVPRKRLEVTDGGLRFFPDVGDSPFVVAAVVSSIKGSILSEGEAEDLYQAGPTNAFAPDDFILLGYPFRLIRSLEILEIHYRQGEVIKQGEPLFTFKGPGSSNKELTLTCPSSGTVLRIFSQPGRTVEGTEPLVLLGPPTVPSRVQSLPWERFAVRQVSSGQAVDLRLALDLLSFTALKRRLACPLELAKRLSELEEFSGWSQQKMAQTLGVNQSTLSRYLSISSHLYPETKKAFRLGRMTAKVTITFRHLHALSRFHRSSSPHLNNESCCRTQLDHYRSLASGEISLASLEKRARRPSPGKGSTATASVYAPQAFFEWAFAKCPGSLRALDLFGADGEIETAASNLSGKDDNDVKCYRFGDDALKGYQAVKDRGRVLISALTRENLLRTARERGYHRQEASGILRRELTMAHIRATLQTCIEKIDVKDAVFLTQDWRSFEITRRLDAFFAEMGFYVIERDRMMEDCTITHFSKLMWKIPTHVGDAWSDRMQ